jgi:hypothetical protein
MGRLALLEPLEVRLCLSDVSFGATINWPAGTNPDSVAVGDFNGDGHADLVTANVNSPNVSVLIGNGSGGFAAPVNFDVGDSPRSVAVGDFNGDGHEDLVSANEGSGANVSVLIGDGTGGFAPAVNSPAGSVPRWGRPNSRVTSRHLESARR